ncbi:imidazolonepropionase [Alteromonas sp. 009811495]|uniref:imidazolonepropionase n=1 Tax=Alteromonas sp. 009811495 TaxID=3002962 RepID=UPI00237E94D2|nr:imidazolonepropionase [Alteromonas sp. 009811495]WDT86958.1 imidazolonepropionase [Alteromonas sp. 009811495]
MNYQYDALFHNVRIASMQDNNALYGELLDTAVAVKDGHIVALIDAQNNREFQQHAEAAKQLIDGNNQWLLPGFVDCHTHLVYGGNRAIEFEQRLRGASYLEIAQRGGGIKGTVASTRSASNEELLKNAVKRAKRLCEEGVTTVEIKSGYGLDIDTEVRMLKVAKQLEQLLPVSVCTTYLGAHALPHEFADDADAYIDFVCEQAMPLMATEHLADAVDVFCETIGFSTAQTERVFNKALELGLPVKAHVEQLSDSKGALLAARYNALSVDHIEYLADSDVPELAQSGTVAVLLPGAFYYLNEVQKPPINALRSHNVPMAVATDFNPGSSPLASILTAMNMACVQFQLTPEEALRGITAHAAKALGLTDRGVIDAGKVADITLWDIDTPAELAYCINGHRPTAIYKGGVHV